MTKYILNGGGINWTWYCHVEVKDNIAYVEREYRLHNFDYSQGAEKHPDAKGSYRIIEKKDDKRKMFEDWPERIATHIEINGKQYKLDKEYPRFDLGKQK